MKYLAVMLALVACSDDSTTKVVHPLCDARPDLCPEGDVEAATYGEPVIVAPSSMMPSEVVSQTSHNNLDVTWHDGRLFFAFRTAPNHFADPAVVQYLVSSEDLVTWRYEGKVAIGTDVREPQLLSLNGKLLYYYTELGKEMFDFEPHGTYVAEWLGPGRLEQPHKAFEGNFLAWRIKTMKRPGEKEGEWAYAFGYDGGENIYDIDGEPIHVHWLRSKDGLAWEPVVPNQPIVLQGGVSETDAVFLDDGGIVAVSRNEAGDASGFGSKICKASADALGDWECIYDKRKFDSPLVFRSGADVYLIGRKTLSNNGDYDLDQDERSLQNQFIEYQGQYWNSPKRTALWKVDPTTLAVTHVMDFPSAGDTCFPEAIELSDKTKLVFNYSSPFDQDPDPTWLEGQLAPTFIYYTVLRLP